MAYHSYFSAPYAQQYDPRTRPGWAGWAGAPANVDLDLDEPELEQPVVDLFPDPDGAVPSFAPPPRAPSSSLSALEAGPPLHRPTPSLKASWS